MVYTIVMTWISKPHPFSILVTVIWVGIIFSFSLQPASISSAQSSFIAQWVMEALTSLSLHTVITVFDIEWGVRKLAHMVNFFVLMVCCLTMFARSLKAFIMPSLGFCLLISMMDESIQWFVEGRSSQMSDVLINMIGATLALLLWLLIHKKGEGSIGT